MVMLNVERRPKIIISDHVAIINPILPLLFPSTKLYFYCHFPESCLNYDIDEIRQIMGAQTTSKNAPDYQYQYHESSVRWKDSEAYKSYTQQLSSALLTAYSALMTLLERYGLRCNRINYVTN